MYYNSAYIGNCNQVGSSFDHGDNQRMLENFVRDVQTKAKK